MGRGGEGEDGEMERDKEDGEKVGDAANVFQLLDEVRIGVNG